MDNKNWEPAGDMATGDALTNCQEWISVPQGTDAFANPAGRQPDTGPGRGGQVRVADSWPDRRDQPVSVALSPAATGWRFPWASG